MAAKRGAKRAGALMGNPPAKTPRKRGQTSTDDGPEAGDCAASTVSAARTSLTTVPPLQETSPDANGSGNNGKRGQGSSKGKGDRPQPVKATTPQVLPLATSCGKCGETFEKARAGLRCESAAEWALTVSVRVDGGSVERRPGIDACKGCFVWWDQHVSMICTWEEFVAKYRTNDCFKNMIDTACKVKAGTMERGFKPEAVCAGVRRLGFVDRACVILNEKELASEAGKQYVAKKDRPSSTMTLKSGDGDDNEEEVYCFSHPQLPFRVYHERFEVFVAKQGTKLPEGCHVWPAQATEAFMKDNSLAEHASPALETIASNLASLEDWVEKRQLPAEEGAEADGSPANGGPEGAGPSAEDVLQCEGIAASANIWPGGRPGSSGDQGGASARQARAFAESCLDGAGVVEVQPEDSASKAGGDLCDLSPEEVSARETVNYYVGKLSLRAAMMANSDGRTLTGIKNQMEKLGDVEVTREYANTLRLHKADYDLACLLQKPGVFQHTEERLDQILRDLGPKVKGDFPYEVSCVVISIKMRYLREKSQFAMFLGMASPWSKGEFSILARTVGAMPGMSAAARIQLYQRVVFKETLVPMIGRGEEGSAGVLNLVQEGHRLYSDVDIFDIAEDETSVLKESLDVFQALSFIVDESVFHATYVDGGEPFEAVAAQTGKAGHAISTIIANAVDGSDFYKNRKVALRNMLPGMLENAAAYSTMRGALGALAVPTGVGVTVETVNELWSLGKTLSSTKKFFRARYCDPDVEVYLGKASQVLSATDALESGSRAPDMDLLRALLALSTQTLEFPCGDRDEELSQRLGVIKRLQSTLGANEFKGKVLQAASVAAMAIADEGAAETLGRHLGFAEGCCFASSADEIKVFLATAAGKLPGVAPAQARASVKNNVERLLELAVMGGAVKEKEDLNASFLQWQLKSALADVGALGKDFAEQSGHGEFRAALRRVQGAKQSLDAFVRPLRGADAHRDFPHLDEAIAEEAERLFEAGRAAVVASADEHMISLMQSLQKSIGARDDGVISWFEGANTWEAFDKVCRQTVCTEANKGLKVSIDKFEEAVDVSKRAREELVSEAPFPRELGAIEKLVFSAKATRAIVSIMGSFAEYEDVQRKGPQEGGFKNIGDLKKRVQSEIRAVRKDCACERTALPPVLLKECAAILWGSGVSHVGKK
ncbi:unnamed protein product [Prorocentrum cordatum]|uniref:Uncharacterized protein n=1 Tax=Prorocentrum cordatum TaxID=2364126 RepID=A0ABN9QFM5_9DINO|nr:unnamed protein product [Polarella glacialis]